jgi:membrane protease YdiL (CAAX protease family)
MNPALSFANKQPFMFALAVLIAWMVLAAIFALATSALLEVAVVDHLPQAAGSLIATLLLLFGTWRIGWLGEIGIAKFGTRLTWLATLILAIYVLLVNIYAYFGEVSFEPASLFTQDAQAIFLRSIQVGFVEEVVFRGIILYGLIRIWGRSKRGRVAAIAVQAVIFGLPHALQILAGVDTASAVSNVLATVIFGVWVGAFVVSAGSLWPAIVLHFGANSFTLVKGLESQWVTPNYLGYLHASLFELPLVLLVCGLS